ncbi:unnamed protein product [Schistosoma haematobium]|nr:unnamed protein product [Schistosoma haematobium]
MELCETVSNAREISSRAKEPCSRLLALCLKRLSNFTIVLVNCLILSQYSTTLSSIFGVQQCAASTSILFLTDTRETAGSREGGQPGISVNLPISLVSLGNERRGIINANCPGLSCVSRCYGRCGAHESCFRISGMDTVGASSSHGFPSVVSPSVLKCFECPWCPYRATLAIGIGQHKRLKHVLEYNESKRAKTVGKRNCRWSKEEDEILNMKANEAFINSNGTAKSVLYDKVSESFPGRSREAIKRRLLGLKWTPPTVGEQERLVDVQSHTIDETLAGNQWRLKLLNAVTTTCDKHHELYKLASALEKAAITTDQGRCRLNKFAQRSFPYTIKAPQERASTKEPAELSMSQIKHTNQRLLQETISSNMKRGAHSVLSGTWKSAYKGKFPLPQDFDTYWKEIFSSESVTDDRPVTSRLPSNWSLIEPITTLEVCAALQNMGKSAPGPDGISPRVLNKRKTERITAFLNLMLALEQVPAHLNLARIVFIPKCDTPLSPEDYRPISITSVIVRCLHSILAKRWSAVVPHLHSQLAFMKRDGCMEGVVCVHAVLQEAQITKRNMVMCSIDISKAFDSVSHETIKRAAKSYGAPEPLLSYIANCYNSSQALIHGEITKVGEGVRQGDPLSPLLFIMCMDEVVQHSSREHGAKMGGRKVDSILFADDMMIFAETTAGMQHKLDQLCVKLQQAGLNINVRKSSSLTMVANGKCKTMCRPTHIQNWRGFLRPHKRHYMF